MNIRTMIVAAGIFTIICNLANIARAKPGDARKEREVSTIVIVKAIKVCNQDHTKCEVLEKKVEFVQPTKAELIKAD